MIDDFLQDEADYFVNENIFYRIEEGQPDGEFEAQKRLFNEAKSKEQPNEEIHFLRATIISLDKEIAEHKKGCPHTTKGDNCPTEEKIKKLQNRINRKINQIKTEIKPLTFDERIIAIFIELSKRENRQGELRAILTDIELDFIDADIREYLDYFKHTGLVDTSRITKDGLDITLRQSGLDHLFNMKNKNQKDDPKTINIITNENYSNSIVTKGDSNNQSDFSLSPGNKNDSKSETSIPSENPSNKNKPASPTKTWQIIGVILTAIGLIFTFLKAIGLI